MKAKPTASQPLSARLVEKILVKLDVDQLAEAIGDKLSEQMLGSLHTDAIVARLVEKYGPEVEEALTSAIIERL